MRNDKFVRVIVKRKIDGKRRRGRPRMAFCKSEGHSGSYGDKENERTRPWLLNKKKK